MKAIQQNSKNTTIKIIAIIALLFFTTQLDGMICKVTFSLHAVNENQMILSAVPFPPHNAGHC